MLKPKPQYDCVWRRDIWEMIRYEAGALLYGMSAIISHYKRSLAHCAIAYLGQARRWSFMKQEA